MHALDAFCEWSKRLGSRGWCWQTALQHFADTAIMSIRRQANHTRRTESETYDIYLLPPNEDPETCSSWLRMRNRDGRYNLMFEEWVTDGPFIISPRITFEAWLVDCFTEPPLPELGGR